MAFPPKEAKNRIFLQSTGANRTRLSWEQTRSKSSRAEAKRTLGGPLLCIVFLASHLFVFSCRYRMPDSTWQLPSRAKPGFYAASRTNRAASQPRRCSFYCDFRSHYDSWLGETRARYRAATFLESMECVTAVWNTRIEQKLGGQRITSRGRQRIKIPH